MICFVCFFACFLTFNCTKTVLFPALGLSVYFCLLGNETKKTDISRYESVLERNNSAQFLRSKKENAGMITYLMALCSLRFAE